MSAPHISNSKNPLKDERYTPTETVEWCLRKTGLERYTLDVAACKYAYVCASYFTKEQDGLAQWWTGDVWCNPPYSAIRPWVERAWDAVFHRREAGAPYANSVSMLLPANRTEQKWWQELVEPYRDRPDSILRVHFLPGRVKFTAHPDDTSDMSTSAPFPCCLLFWRGK